MQKPDPRLPPPFTPTPEQQQAGLNTPVLQPTPDDHTYLGALLEALKRAAPGDIQ